MQTPPAHQLACLHHFRATHAPRQVDCGDWAWRYLAAGNVGRAVVLLPGAFVGAEMWWHVIAALENRYRVLAPEMPAKTLSLSELSAAFLKLLEAEKIEQAIIVGYSAGGGLAQALLNAHPERIAHLVLSHCTLFSADTARRVQRLVSVVRLLPLPLIRAIFTLRSRRYPAASAWADFTRAFFAERIATLEKAALIHFFENGVEAARAFRIDPATLQHWPGQMLLLSSKDDATTFPRLPELQARYPSAHTRVLEQGGHHAVLLFPEIYTSTLANFLDGLA